MSLFKYSSLFFDFVESSSSKSAAKFLSLIDFGFEPKSILDVGCARGSWLAQWKLKGLEIYGLDGNYLDISTLLIKPEEFSALDISLPFNLKRKFDIVECLEVAEHINESSADDLIKNLVTHSDIVLFSAAQPGQGGENHVNEKPIRYWAEKFIDYGFLAYDYPRAVISSQKDIEPWYRYNMMLFANNSGAAKLSQSVIETRVLDYNKFKNFSTPVWYFSSCVIRVLPRFFVDFLARAKHLFSLFIFKFKKK
jgi:2-polyprenyl-3-methyl-5-hydroxy-6-metoxy-1,4-benzoquinol methylase